MREAWPDLRRPEWEKTASTLQRWSQIIGKTRLTLAPMVNHWWQVTLYVTARGLTTSPMYAGHRAVEIEFDFLAHRLLLRSSDERQAELRLRPCSVAQFYREYLTALSDLDLRIHLWPVPRELPDALPFDQDEEHRSYDPVWAQSFFGALLQADRLLKEFRGKFLGKASPVHFFWGAFDLAVTRFSGRRAPRHPGGVPNMPDWVVREAYSHEVSSAGFWPGGGGFPEAAFYSYAYPEPAGYAQAEVRPAAARYDSTLKEFVLPYEAVRRSRDPDQDVREFLQSTYEAAADLGRWDRDALERRAAAQPFEQAGATVH